MIDGIRKALMYRDLACRIIDDLTKERYILDVDKDKLNKIKELFGDAVKEVLSVIEFDGDVKNCIP